MALSKEELVELVQNDVEKFNEYMKSQEEVDLGEVDFSYAKIENADFTNADLNSSSFADAHLTNVKFNNTDLTAVLFTRSTLLECDLSEAILSGADFSYATAHYCNFTDADLAGAVFQESDLSDSDFAGAYNLNTCRFDEETVWPELTMLPEDFDTTSGKDDLSALKDDDDYESVEEY